MGRQFCTRARRRPLVYNFGVRLIGRQSVSPECYFINYVERGHSTMKKVTELFTHLKLIIDI